MWPPSNIAKVARSQASLLLPASFPSLLPKLGFRKCGAPVHFAAVLLFILCRAQPLFPKIPAHFESGASSRLPETISSFNTVRTSWDPKIIGASVLSLACEAIAPTFVAVILRFLNYCNSVSRCRLVAARVFISLRNSSCSPDGSSASSAF